MDLGVESSNLSPSILFKAYFILNFDTELTYKIQMDRILIVFIFIALVFLPVISFAQEGNYVFHVEPPPDYVRDTVPEKSFADWLRKLPIKSGNPPVYLFNGEPKGNQAAHHAVLDMDIGDRDLQQCADAVLRLRAEYFFSMNHYDSIQFNFTSGDRAYFRKWIEGYRPIIDGNDVRWHKSAGVDSSYNNFRKYLNTVFTYAGSYSLRRELKRVENISDMNIGDVFIQGGFPGHAVIVIDMAANTTTGDKAFLLAQSYMPAQDIHILKNPDKSMLTPWYSTNFDGKLYTPEWVFEKNDLMRF